MPVMMKQAEFWIQDDARLNILAIPKAGATTKQQQQSRTARVPRRDPESRYCKEERAVELAKWRHKSGACYNKTVELGRLAIYFEFVGMHKDGWPDRKSGCTSNQKSAGETRAEKSRAAPPHSMP